MGGSSLGVGMIGYSFMGAVHSQTLAASLGQRTVLLARWRARCRRLLSRRLRRLRDAGKTDWSGAHFS